MEKGKKRNGEKEYSSNEENIEKELEVLIEKIKTRNNGIKKMMDDIEKKTKKESINNQ